VTDQSTDTTSPVPSREVPERLRKIVSTPAAVVRFTTEITVLAALATWAMHLPYPLPVRGLLALGAAGASAAVWGRFVAPRSTARLTDPARLAVEAAV
jgi:hypothetical protein